MFGENKSLQEAGFEPANHPRDTGRVALNNLKYYSVYIQYSKSP